MISVSAVVKGDLGKWLKAVETAQNERLKRKLADAALQIHANVLYLINQQSNGRLQKRYYRGRQPKVVVVSKPGDAANSDTGAYIRSWKFKIDTANKISKVYSTSPYAKALEFGYKQNNLDKRPALQPAFDMYIAKNKGKWQKVKVKA